MKRFLRFIFVCVIMTLFLGVIEGCGTEALNGASSDAENVETVQKQIEDNHSDDGHIVVGISMPDKLLERWNRDGAFLEKEFKKNGYEVILSYAGNLIDRQISDIRKMIEKKADLIVISPIDGAALTSVLEEAAKANVKIIAYDRLIMDTDVVDYYVSFDNYMVGELQADYIIEALDLDNSLSPKTIEIVAGDPVDNNARYFYSGAMDRLEPYFDSGKLTIKSGQKGFYETATGTWSTEIAQQRVQIIINSYYKTEMLDAILCANDSTALGAVNALKSDYSFDNKVVVTGQDADMANVYNILSGDQSMTVFKTLQNETIVTVDLAEAVLEGKEPDADFIESANWSFDCKYDTTGYNNGKKDVTSFLLIPFTVDKENIQEELFDTGFYTYNSGGLIVPGE